MDPSNQPPDAWTSSDKSVLLPRTPPPAACQDYPVGHLPFPRPPVPQGTHAKGSFPEQSMVTIQPAGFVTAAPLDNPEPEYLCYSIFTILCCCVPLGIAALVFSSSTRNANYSGQQVLAEKNSKTARILNHFAVAFGIVVAVLFFTFEFVID